jgi:hypothetical protein
MGKHASIDDRGQSEALDRSDVEADLGRDLVPMALLHSILAECYSQRYIRLKLIDVFLHSLCNLCDLGEFFVPEESENSSHYLVAVFEGLIKFSGIELLPDLRKP